MTLPTKATSYGAIPSYEITGRQDDDNLVRILGHKDIRITTDTEYRFALVEFHPDLPDDRRTLEAVNIFAERRGLKVMPLEAGLLLAHKIRAMKKRTKSVLLMHELVMDDGGDPAEDQHDHWYQLCVERDGTFRAHHVMWSPGVSDVKFPKKERPFTFIFLRPEGEVKDEGQETLLITKADFPWPLNLYVLHIYKGKHQKRGVDIYWTPEGEAHKLDSSSAYKYGDLLAKEIVGHNYSPELRYKLAQIMNIPRSLGRAKHPHKDLGDLFAEIFMRGRSRGSG